MLKIPGMLSTMAVSLLLSAQAIAQDLTASTVLATVGDEEIMLTENQSTYIPLGAVHRLENPGKVDLRLIEVQSGVYLGEDDIVRYEDVYARG